MNLLDLAEEAGISPKKAASTKGGEYKSFCPKCREGKDRFCIWPNDGKTGVYWCRVCECRGDGIQFCRDFLGMTYHQACDHLGVVQASTKKALSYAPQKKQKFSPAISLPVSSLWKEAAEVFVATAHQQLLRSQEALASLLARGFDLTTIRRFSLGWNPGDCFEDRGLWGMPTLINPNGFPKRQWLPKGIVIPTYWKEQIIRVKVRRAAWHSGDEFPKYVEVSGSKKSLSVYGNPRLPIIIVESELDAMLVQQFAGHLVCSVALGGVSKKPDAELHQILLQAPLILLSLDFDEGGQKKCTFWLRRYSNIRPWPAPHGKSIGDAIKIFPADMASWVNAGLFVF